MKTLRPVGKPSRPLTILGPQLPPVDEMEMDEDAMLAEAAQAAEALGAEADEPTTNTLEVGEILIGDVEKSTQTN